MYIDVLGSWDTGGRRLTINSGFSYYPSTPDFAFRVRVFTCNHKARRRSAGQERGGAMLAGCGRGRTVLWARPVRIPIVGGVNVRPDLPSGTSARAPLCVGADGIR